MRRDFTCARETQRVTVNLGVRGAISAMWSGATDAMAALAQQVATLSTETHFPELGFDCVLHVLRSLPIYDALQLATVSSDWKLAANARLAEETVLDLSCATASVDSSLVSWLLGRMPRVCKLDLTDCVGVTMSAVSGTVFSLLAELMYIDVSGTAIDAHSFFELWSLPDINKLNVSGCPRLVEMEMCQHARPPSATLLHLFLARCPRLTGQASVSCLARLAPGLIELDVSGYETMPSAVVSVIAHSCRQLKTIRLAECEQLDDAAVGALASKCQHLREVVFSWCGEITIEAVEALAQGCEKLMCVDLRCCTRVQAVHVAGFFGLSRVWRSLMELNLNRCDCTGAAPPVWWSLSTLTKCESLCTLDLGWLTDLVTDDVLKDLIFGLKHLERLSLEGCKQL